MNNVKTIILNNSKYLVNKDGSLTKEEPSTTDFDNVNKPSHYCEGRKYEPIKVIQDWQLDFCLGNTVKYISRAGRKNSAAMNQIDKTIQDLEKAEFYLRYKINELKEMKSSTNPKNPITSSEEE